MDNSFLKPNDPGILQEVIQRVLLGVNTSIPGTIQSFNSENQTAVIVPNIRSIENRRDGTTVYTQLPDLIEVPLVFPYSTTTGFSVTFPVAQGDQCLVIFAQRSIDNWQEYGRVQNPVEINYPRAHSLSDAMAIVGLIPKTNPIQNFQIDCVETRDTNRSHRVTVYDDKIQIFSVSSIVAVEWNAVTPYEEGMIVSIDSGKKFKALKDNTGVDPESDKETWQPYKYSLFEVSNEQISGETGKSSFVMAEENITLDSGDIILKGNVKIDGILSGSTSLLPVTTANGILHTTKIINATHIHDGVTAGDDNTGGVK
ncbi:MAG: Gp138 family membrane-puncturing spike protein [Candidatus Aenigmarchaeota archaeon]|nr:Gp138 family membrane-puncturing spike protein [Candidatus Aenigmarchaeota archaeon]